MTAATLTFDTHKFIKLLRDTGMSEPQAEAVVATVAHSREADADNLATKGDIRELKGEMREMELRLKVQLGGMIMALGGILIAIKFFG